MAINNENKENTPLNVIEVEPNFKLITSTSHHKHRSSKHSSHHSSHHRHKKHRKSKARIVRRILISVGSALLALVLVAVGVFFYLLNAGKHELKSDDLNIVAPQIAEVKDDGQYVMYNNELYQFNEDVVNILFIGVDENNGYEMDDEIGNNGQSDFIALMALDSKNHKMTLINIPRDIMTDIKVYSKTGGYTGMEKLQIGLSYAYGDGKETSCLNTMDAVKRIFYNVPINSYFSLKLEGVSAVNDSIGGIDVKSPETIGNFVKGETYHLEGEDAELFVRSRSMEIANANLLRNERQKVYLKAFMEKAISGTKKNISMPLDLYNASAPYSCTNLNTTKITYLASEFIINGGMTTKVISVPVDVTQNENHAENYIKEKEFYELFLSVFYEKVN